MKYVKWMKEEHQRKEFRKIIEHQIQDKNTLGKYAAKLYRTFFTIANTTEINKVYGHL